MHSQPEKSDGEVTVFPNVASHVQIPTMSSSAEFITGTVFVAGMVVIALNAIWIVRWRTYFLLNHQSRSRKISVPHPGNFAFVFPLRDALAIIRKP